MELRLTSARRAILDVLEKTDHHLCIQEIHQDIKERLPSVNLSTIYRSLEYLGQIGLISVSDMGQGNLVYQRVTEHAHHHLICNQCHTTYDLEANLISSLFAEIQETRNFKILTNHLVIFGLCEACQQ